MKKSYNKINRKINVEKALLCLVFIAVAAIMYACIELVERKYLIEVKRIYIYIFNIVSISILGIILSISKSRSSYINKNKELILAGESFRELSSSLNYVIFQFNYIPKRKIEYISPSVFRAIGYTPEEICSKKIMPNIYIYPDDYKIWNDLINLDNVTSEPVIVRIINKDKELKWFEINKAYTYDDNGNIISLYCFAQDISARKYIESQKNESEKRMKDIINFLPDPTFAINTKGEVIIWNKAMEELTGIKAEEIVGKEDYEYAIPFYGKKVPLLVNLMLENDENIENLYPVLLKEQETVITEKFLPFFEEKGKYVWVKATYLHDNKENIVGAIESVRDVTEHTQWEKTLKYRFEFENLISMISTEFIDCEEEEIDEKINTSLEKLSKLINADCAYVFKYSDDNMKFKRVWEWTEKAVDSRREELMGCKINYGSWWLERLRKCEIINVSDLNELPEEADFEMKKFGAIDVKSIICIPMVYKDNVIGFVSFYSKKGWAKWEEENLRLLRIVAEIFSNALHRQAIENQIKKAINAAETAYVAKSEFLANMSHEIRTPINGIIGMTNLTLLEDLSIEHKENLNIIKTCADSLLNIINDILDFSKIEAGKMKIDNMEFDIRNLIEKIVKTHAVLANEKALKLKCSIDSSISRVIISDPVRLQQILNNLIGNAIKFTEIGEINITVEKLKEDNNYLKFAIADTGIGISKEEKNKLFKSFSQVDGSVTRKFGGTGLGLAISKQLVELMDGNIWVESVKGKGSTFYFTVKVEYKNKPKFNQKFFDKICSCNSNQKYHILLVEDDRNNQIVTIRMLKLKEHIVDVANDGLEALELLGKRKYDMIFMDIQLPQMDGMEVTRRIRERESKTGEHIPIVALTAYALQGDRERFLSAGMDDYVAKPIHLEELFGAIDRVMQKGEEFTKRNNVCYNNNKQQEADLRVFDYDTPLEDYGSEDVIVLKLKEAINAKEYKEIEIYANLLKDCADTSNDKTVSNIAFKIKLASRKKDIDTIHEYINKISDK